MPLDLSHGTNSTGPNDLAEFTRENRFLSVSETFFGSNPTVTSLRRDGFETGAETVEDLRDHINTSYGLWDRDDIQSLQRLEVREAYAEGKIRPVVIVSCDYACISQETIMVAPIRTKPPPFACPGLVKVESLKSYGKLHGFIRFDLILFFPRAQIGNRVLHHFTNLDDIETINASLKASLGLP